MLKIPQTMTNQGLAFLSALASKNTGGVFLELGPLFGSSTDAIAKGRLIDEPIHSIDTFEDAPWIKKRVGLSLSRAIHSKFTKDISNLIVHEGQSPNVVVDTWKDKIGFYFDDATRNDPEWSDNFNFFKPFFSEDCIICGGDFSGAWEVLLRNIYQYVDEHSLKLFVLGRVWAVTHKDDHRLEEAVDDVLPKLKNSYITAKVEGKEYTNKAGVWTWGSHQDKPLEEFSLDTTDIEGSFTILKDQKTLQMGEFGKGPIRLQDANQVSFQSNSDIKVQFCVLQANGRTKNGKAIPSGQIFSIKEDEKIVSVRLTD